MFYFIAYTIYSQQGLSLCTYHLSLYSTATQNILCWGLCWTIPPNIALGIPTCWVYQHVGYTNMLVSKNARICVTANAKPQCESVEYRLCWVPKAKCLHWPCTFHLFVCRFHSRWVPFFSGIWALRIDKGSPD